MPTPESMSRIDLMRRRCLVFGLGRFGGGVGAVRYLARHGAAVTVVDHADPATLQESLAAIRGMNVTEFVGPGSEPDLEACDLVVVNPAIDKRRSALYREIVRRGIPRTTEINLFLSACKADVVGVTGSFGKSTVTAMLGAAFEALSGSGELPWRKVYIGGNLGGSLLDEVDRIAENDIVVLELSSAQLEDLPSATCEAVGVVLTNLYPHHLERYDSVTAYAEAKLNLLRAAKPGAPAVVGELDKCIATRVEDAIARAGLRIARPRGVDGSELRAIGRHNETNASQVLALLEEFGLATAAARRAVREFTGLPHRLESVGEQGRVSFLNDSKSTAPVAIRTAIDALPAEPHLALICGGAEKGADFRSAAAVVLQRALFAITCGECGARFAQALREAKASMGQGGRCTILEARDLDAAVALARDSLEEASAKEARGIVLFSPGAPSFDAYVNFEARGEHFRSIVRGFGGR